MQFQPLVWLCVRGPSGAIDNSIMPLHHVSIIASSQKDDTTKVRGNVALTGLSRRLVAEHDFTPHHA